MELEQHIETGNYHDLDLLLVSSPDLLKKPTSQGVSPLLLACYYYKDKVIETILKHTKQITIHEACAVGMLEPVQQIISLHKSSIEQLSEHGFRPLGIASHFGHEDIVRHLLLHSADPNLPSQNGHNVFPLHSALSNNHSGVAKMLIEAGAYVNSLQNGNTTPLHLAVQNGNIDLIILLLENGADIHIQNVSGQNASDIAYEKGYREIGEILKPEVK